MHLALLDRHERDQQLHSYLAVANGGYRSYIADVRVACMETDYMPFNRLGNRVKTNGIADDRNIGGDLLLRLHEESARPTYAAHIFSMALYRIMKTPMRGHLHFRAIALDSYHPHRDPSAA